jgi:uncharacterized protein (DUF1684 family)
VLSLLDWRRRIGDLYTEIRDARDKQLAWRRWHATRARLFREHPQSPIPASERPRYPGPFAYDYDPAWRLTGSVQALDGTRLELPASRDGVMAFRRFGLAHFAYGATEMMLELYWLEGYGGGVFLPFADATSGDETYGAGRYLLDTIKGADLGTEGDELVLDFNFAYQPSCAYDPGWACPLAPSANRLPLAVRAGERVAPG